MTTAVETRITLLPGQAALLRDFTSSVLAAIAGCVAGETLIDTPSGAYPIKDMLGFSQVLTLTDKGIQTAGAFIFRKGKAQLYRLTLESGQTIEATSNHYLLVENDHRLLWVSVGELMQSSEAWDSVHVVSVSPSESLLSPQQSNQELYQLGQLSGVRHYSDRAQDYRGHCLRGFGLYDPQPRWGVSSDLLRFPLQADVPGYSQRLSGMDDQDTLQGHSHPYPLVVLPSRNSLAPSHDHDRVGQSRALPLPCGLSQGLGSSPLPSRKLTCDSRLPSSLDGLFQPVSNSFGVPYYHLQFLLSHTLSKVTSIVPTTIASYYDMVVPKYHNYIAQGMIHHNTGGGKTILGYWWLHSRMEAMPGNTWGVAEPTYKMLDTVILNSSDPDRPNLVEYLTRAQHNPYWIDKQSLILGTDFGQIYLSSADNPDSMQGAALKGYWLDESGQMRTLAHDVARQRCSMLSGQVLHTTTPYNLGALKTDIWDRRNEPGTHVETWRSIDRPGFPQERYEEERRRLPSWRFAMMYDAKFDRPAGLIYSAFNESVCLIERFPIPSSWLIYVGHDFGADNPCALFYAQDTATGNFYLFHEYLPGTGYSANEHAIEFKKIVHGYNVIQRVGGSKAGEDEVRQLYNAHGWVISEPKLGRVEARIDKVTGLHLLNKVFVFRDLRNYLDEKRTFSREMDSNGLATEKIADEARFHCMSAEQYILSGFTPETVVVTEHYASSPSRAQALGMASRGRGFVRR